MQQIKENDAGIRNTPGTKIENSKTGEIIYTPPDGEELIRNLLSNFENWIKFELLYDINIHCIII